MPAKGQKQNDKSTSFDLTKLMKQVEGQSYPPVEKWNPPFCGDIDMRISSDGHWHYMGTPITREKMVRLFSTVLRRDDDKKYYLVTPVEKIGITVDDAPFLAAHLTTTGIGAGRVLHFTTTVGDEVIADKTNKIVVDVDEKTLEPRPYVHIRRDLWALISRSVFYELVELAEEDGDELIIYSQGERFSLGRIEKELT